MTEVKNFTQKGTPVGTDLVAGMQGAKGVGDERLFALEDIDAASGLTYLNNYAPLGNGFTVETVDTSVTSDGADISILVQKLGGGNFTVLLAEGLLTFTATSINLTAGTDTVPQINYVYIIDTAGTATLAVSTSGWPTGVDYAAIATVLVQSIGTVQTDLALKVHQWTDHMGNGEPNGHLAHINSWIRHQHAHWMSGAAGSISITPNGGAPDNVFFANTAGMVHQLHMHDFPVRDMSLGDDIYVANGDGSTIVDYEQFSDLNGILTDSNNVSLSGRYFNLVFWGVVSEDAVDCKIFINLPTASYSSSANALTDIDKASVFSFPTDFIGTAFMIGRVTLRHQTSASGTWTEVGYESLLGQNPNNIAGTGLAGVTDHGGLSGLADDDHPHYLLADGSRILTDTLKITEQAAAAADAAGVGQIWIKTGTPNELWFTDDTGTDFQINGTEVTGTEAQIYVFNSSGVLVAVTMSGDGTITAAGVLDVASLNTVIIQNYRIKSAAAPATTGTITLDYRDGPDFTVTLTGNATIAFSNWPASGTLGKITISVTNGSSAYTLDITTNIHLWPDGTIPTFTAVIGANDEFVFWTRDSGTVVKGATPGQAFA